MDMYIRTQPLTPSELKVFREKQTARNGEVMNVTDIKYTCDECDLAPTCDLAFDGYNTNGDCLLSK